MDLSASESANCYLVKTAGDYKFKAVKGNSTDTVGEVADVAVLWESFGTSTAPNEGDIITKGSVSYSASDNYIQFSTPSTFAQGNAVIAAKDASGTILWSWHIWCATEGWEEQTYWDKDDHSKSVGIMMDRNLGATSAAIPTSANDVSSLGLLYQWGRKDPFLGASAFASSTKAASTNSTSWDKKTAKLTTDDAIENPMIFYVGGYDYGLSSGWASDKTKYDPCPAGWKVPDGGTSGIWYKASGANPDIDSDKHNESYGLNCGGLFGSAETIWYPATGMLDYYDFTLADYNVGYSAHYLSNTIYTGGNMGPNAYAFYVSISGDSYFRMYNIMPDGYHFTVAGNPVRCQKVTSK